MINEDGTAECRAVMARMGRDGSIWRFDVVCGSVGVDADSRQGRRARPTGSRWDRAEKAYGRRAGSSTCLRPVRRGEVPGSSTSRPIR